MSLIVLKDRGYQEYKNIVRESPELIEEAAENTPESFGRPKPKTSKREKLSIRMLNLATVSLSTSALIIAVFIAYTYRDSLFTKSNVNLVSPADLPPLEALPKDIAEARELLTNTNSLWKCDKGQFTNSPDSEGAGNCEYMWNGKDEAKGQPQGSRFIAPSVSKP